MESSNQVQQRGFPAARWSNNTEEFSGFHFQIDVVERQQARTVVGLVAEPIPQLLAVAEYITKELAICVVCGNPANRSQRISPRGGRVVVGSVETYEARCRRCFVPSPVEATAPETLDLFED